MDTSPLPLQSGDSGPVVSQLQRRLIDAGFANIAENATFDESTHKAVRQLQTDRGLPADGVVDQRTWTTLVEAGYRLGDRPLYRHNPMLRGADVSALQLKLGALGFDPGWVDGILGPDTERAILDFQRNAALTTDGIAGAATVAELDRFGGRHDNAAPSVSMVRERHKLLSANPQLAGRRVVVGECGQCPGLADAIGRALRRSGAEALVLHDPDLSTQAHTANAFDGALYIGFGVDEHPRADVHYFSTDGFTSSGGEALALTAQVFLPRVLPVDVVETFGGRSPILRETRMPALWCEIGPASTVVRRSAALADTIVTMLQDWCLAPLGDDN